MITKLVSYDFDGTLIHTPTPETGRPAWEKATGLSWAGRGWWGNPESLNLHVFYPPVNQWVYNKYIQDVADESTYTFIATGRLARLDRHVQKVLNLHGIDAPLFCNTGGDTLRFKCKLFEKMIEKYDKATEFIMYDDRQEHLQHFVEWAKKQPIKVSIIDVINKKQIF